MVSKNGKSYEACLSYSVRRQSILLAMWNITLFVTVHVLVCSNVEKHNIFGCVTYLYR